jgi:hypothetical protein
MGARSQDHSCPRIAPEVLTFRQAFTQAPPSGGDSLPPDVWSTSVEYPGTDLMLENIPLAPDQILRGFVELRKVKLESRCR